MVTQDIYESFEMYVTAVWMGKIESFGMYGSFGGVQLRDLECIRVSKGYNQEFYECVKVLKR